MNAVTKTLQQHSWTWRMGQWSLTKVHAWLFLLILLVISSAFAVVYSRDLDRRLTSELQQIQSTRADLQEEWSQLLLEQSTWSTQARIQRIAQTQLQMREPEQSSIIMVRS